MTNVAEALIDHDAEEVEVEVQGAAVALRQEQTPAIATPLPRTPMEMAYQLIQNGADLGSVKEMLAVSRELAAEQARRAFDAAIAEAKSEIPIVGKNATGHNNKRYADFSAYAAALKPILAKHGLSYRFRTEQGDRITVTCVLSHKDGHSEENSLSGPADTSGSKNAIQAVGSTLTYLQRYTLIQALGLAASEDDDGRASDADNGPITDEQAAILRKLIEDGGRDVVMFCKYFKIESVPELPAKDFGRAVTALSRKVAQ